MDLNKISSKNINALENQSASQSKHRSKVSKRPVRHSSGSNHKATKLSSQPKKTTASKPKDYSNIRISRDVSNRLGALKQVTGYSSRSALLARMLEIAHFVLLDSKSKKRKFNHDLRLIVKKQKLLAELKKQM